MSNLWCRAFESYDGLMILSSPGVHTHACSLLQRYGVRGSRVLDVAAGTGAFLARLRDQGFEELRAIERDIAHFGLPAATVTAADLNLDFAGVDAGPFELVSAIEVIEHLESPLHFLRELAKLVAPGGHLLVSTPNTAHWRSRIRFLLHGELRYFGASDYVENRHVSPITPAYMALMLEETGFAVVECSTAGSFRGPLKSAMLSPALCVLKRLVGPAIDGDSIVCLAKRVSPT